MLSVEADHILSLEYKRVIARTQLIRKTRDESRRQLEVLEEMQHEETAREPKQQRQARQDADKQCTQRQ